ncbi:MAG: hypothetical protein QM662_08245 [Gordonia sp. (in: high G+C Gram-positive bacteria)]
MNIRTSVATALIAGAAVFGVAACGDDADTANTSTTNTSATAPASGTGTAGASSEAPAPADLSVEQARTILRAAVNPETSDADLDTYVDTSNAAAKPALKAFVEHAAPHGYGPDAFAVTSVAADGADKATVHATITSPHDPSHTAIPLPLSFVKVDGTWKLSFDAVNAIVAAQGGH